MEAARRRDARGAAPELVVVACAAAVLAYVGLARLLARRASADVRVTTYGLAREFGELGGRGTRPAEARRKAWDAEGYAASLDDAARTGVLPPRRLPPPQRLAAELRARLVAALAPPPAPRRAAAYADGTAGPPAYLLAAVVTVRVRQGEANAWGRAVIRDRVEYLLWAGVEHVFAYDAALTDAEALQRELAPHVARGALTYVPWFKAQDARAPLGANVKAWDDAYARYRRAAVYVIALDVGQYPLPGGGATPTPGFLSRPAAERGGRGGREQAPARGSPRRRR